MGASEALSLDTGDEITDEYREQVDELIGELEELDLETDEAQDARDALVDVANEFLDADEISEDLGSEQFAEFETFTTTCVPYLSATSASN